MLAALFGASDVFKDWRGEDVEWRAERKRLREAKRAAELSERAED